MKKFSYLISLFSMSMFLLSSCGGGAKQPVQEATATDSVKSFKVGNGVNVSHWLSQSDDRGEARANKITKKDFDSIASMGFDFVRIPVDEVQLYDENMNRDNEAFQLLQNAINWALEDSMNVVVDLHVVRSHHFNNENSNANNLFQDSTAQNKFIAIWLDMQKTLKDYPTDRVAYEILNEAVAPTAEAWNLLLNKACKALRVAEPNRYLVIGSNRWQTVENFDSLRVPANDPNLILSFHYYNPSLVTHHRAPWTEYKDYDGPISYPGYPIADTAIYKKYPKMVSLLRQLNDKPWSKEKMVEDFKPAINKAKELGLQLFCGEFGVYPKYIDKETRLRWYNDMVSTFREYNIANCHWCYKGDFPIVNEDGSANELPAILTRK